MSNESLFARAQQFIPAGVNSPVRAFRAVGGAPRFIARGEGASMWDTEGRRYIDYIGSWGPMVAGHAHPEVVAAVCAAAKKGLSFGAPTEAETEMAELLCKLLPGMELVRLVSSGTEATMTALRLARGYTGRNRVIKFEGCYHGHADSLLVKAGSGALTFGQPSSSGVPPQVAADTLVLDYNDATQLERCFAENGKDIAAVIVEPVVGNMNLVVAQAGVSAMPCANYARKHGAVLILDEVMTGFRVGLGGAQGRYGIQPDLTTLGKVIGGGMPVGAFGGRREIMQKIAPLGAGVSGGHAVGQPGRGRGRAGDPEAGAGARFLRKIGREDTGLDRGSSGGGEKARRGVFGASDRRHVRHLFPRRRTAKLRRSHAMRQGSVQPVLSRDAGPRRALRAFGLRGWFRVRGTQRAGHRGDRQRGRCRVRDHGQIGGGCGPRFSGLVRSSACLAVCSAHFQVVADFAQ